jgi:hypothetical protein
MLNWTVPVGEIESPDCFAATAAVKLTTPPKVDGFALEATVVVVCALFTIWLTAFDVLAAKFALPPYTAVIG